MKRQEEDENADEEIHIPSESRVGKKLSDLTIKRVIVVVLLMLIMLPLFETDFYITNETSWDFGLDELMSFYGEEGFELIRQEYISYHEDKTRPIIYLSYERDDNE